MREAKIGLLHVELELESQNKVFRCCLRLSTRDINEVDWFIRRIEGRELSGSEFVACRSFLQDIKLI